MERLSQGNISNPTHTAAGYLYLDTATSGTMRHSSKGRCLCKLSLLFNSQIKYGVVMPHFPEDIGLQRPFKKI